MRHSLFASIRYYVAAAVFSLVGAAPIVPAHALLNVDITRGNAEPLPIAITDFSGRENDRAIGEDIARVVRADLERSGLFRPIDRQAFIEEITSNEQVPQFASWRQINADGLVTGMVKSEGGKLQVAFRLWDVYSEKQIGAMTYNTDPANWRRIAHMVADQIYQRLTGEEGYFDTRIVYIAESGAKNKRIKRLAIMDQDGENHQFLTDGSDLVLTPRFSPAMQEVIYMAYHGRKPRVYIRNLETGKDRLLGNFPGMSFAPRFSPKGRKAVMSVSLDGNSEIFELDLTTGEKRRLTNDPAIDTSPSFAPDEKQIVFNSDRGGSQQIYVMDASGGNVHRISFGDGKYGTPVWSPRGDLIAFTKIYQGKFYIGVMRPDGSGERLLTESYLDEGPTWSPNGRVIMFTRESAPGWGGDGRSRLFSVDLTGYNEREMVTPLEASDPAWSPLRK
ncbi:MAG: tolB [Rickettsiales bacterium]|nr:tolB [Rickettsiales bacterium]